MGLLDQRRRERVDVVEWIDDSRRALVWRYPRRSSPIQPGAQLIVRPGQVAVFTNAGQVADVFPPERYALTAATLPALAKLQGWPAELDAPFRAEIYFVSTRQVEDLRWGNPSPVLLRDPSFGPVRVRAFGRYSVGATDPTALIGDLVGTDGGFDPDELTEMLRAAIADAFTDMVGAGRIGALDLAAHYRDIGEALRRAACERLSAARGIELSRVMILNVALPDEIERALDARTGMRAAGGEAVESASPPPPPPPMWHIAVGGRVQGPYAIEDLLQGLRRGQLGADTFVWTAGMRDWQMLDQVPLLAAHLVPGQRRPPAPGR